MRRGDDVKVEQTWKATLPVLLLSSAVCCAAHAEGALFTVEEIQSFYPEIFDAKATGVSGADAPRSKVSVDLAEVPEGNPLAPLITQNPHLIRYFLHNGSLSRDALQAAASAPDFPSSYFELLRNDAAFNSSFLETADRFLKGRGGGIRDYRGRPDRQVAFEDVLNTAVRFVYPDFFDPEGNIGAHICTGINGLADLDLEPDPFLEALVYSALLSELYDGDSPVQERIRYALDLARSLMLSTDESVALTRAQGVAWAVLRESPEFQASLRQRYERVGELLPIVIDFGDGPP